MTTPRQPQSDADRIIAAQHADARRTRRLLLWILLGVPAVGVLAWLIASAVHSSGTAGDPHAGTGPLVADTTTETAVFHPHCVPPSYLDPAASGQTPCAAPAAPTTPAGGATTIPAGGGTFVPGVSIAAGTWHTAGGAGCQWERLDADPDDNPAANTLASGEGVGPMTFTVHPTDGAVELSGQCAWTRTG